MGALVVYKAGVGHVGLPTGLTLVRLLPSMEPLVDSKARTASERPSTVFALIVFFPSVHNFMLNKAGIIFEEFPTLITLMGFPKSTGFLLQMEMRISIDVLHTFALFTASLAYTDGLVCNVVWAQR